MGAGDYRYEHFTTKRLLQDIRFGKSTPRQGEALPEFDLATTDGGRVTKTDFVGDRPLLLILGSITCPMTASAMPALKRLYARFSERIAFLMVNVREAHPGENFPQPGTPAEKLEHARALRDMYEIPWPVAVDDVDGTLHQALDGKPNAAFLADREGKVAFRAHWARDEAGLRRALESVSRGERPVKRESRAMLLPVARAMGHVHRVMGIAGPQARRDLLLAGTAMALAGMVATALRPLSPDWRGVAASAVLAVATAAEVGSVAWWIL
jgi:hypothetical protein